MKRILALLLVATLAGCTSNTESTPAPESTLEDALAAYLDGNISSNMHIIANWTESGTQEIDAKGDLLAVDRGSAVHLLNVSDPANVFEEAILQPNGVVDVKFSKIGDYLFTAEDESASGTPAAGTGPFVGGITVFDIEDPANPSLLFFQGVGEHRGPHMIHTHVIDGDEYLFLASAEVHILKFDAEAMSLTEVARYQPDLLTEFNRSPDVVDVLYQGWAHDMFVETVNNVTTMFVANWDAGLRIVNVTDPSNPVEDGSWNTFPGGHSGNLHSVSSDWIGDTRITIGSVEVGFSVVGGVPYALNEEVPALYIWDTTDPSNIELLGEWINPHGYPAGRSDIGEPLRSTHNIQFEEGRIYLAHYELGYFILGASNMTEWANPVMLAFESHAPMNTWDILVLDGMTVTSGSEGVYFRHYAGEQKPGLTSRA